MRLPAASRWTTRRRLIATIVFLVWIGIGGVWLAAFSSPSLQLVISQQKNDHSTSLETGTSEPVLAETTRINPGFLLWFGLNITVLGVYLWRPDWMEASRGQYGHLILFLLLFSVLAWLQLQIFSEITPALLFWTVVGLGNLGLFYVFRRSHKRFFIAVCVVMIVWTVLIQAYILLSSPNSLSNDERYYASVAATGAAGLGLYPFLQDYPPMPIMGGVGHLAWLYVIAYKLFGPHIWALRLVTCLTLLTSLPPIFLLFRRWYDNTTAWLAVAILPASFMMILPHTIRMDALTVTWVWWSLLVASIALERRTWRWHLFAGFFMALGLEAHIHTSIITIACGLLYLMLSFRRAERWTWLRATAIYSTGVVIGICVYLVLNVLPNPEAFFRTAGNAARFSPGSMALGSATESTVLEKIVQSFLVLPKLWEHLQNRLMNYILFVEPVELFIVAFALVLLLRRRNKTDRMVLMLLIGVCGAGFFILNNSSPQYTSHIYPVFLLCIPPAFTYGLSNVKDTGPSPILTLITSTVLFSFFLATATTWPQRDPAEGIVVDFAADQIEFISTHVSTGCTIMGTGDVYVSSFLNYPRYASHGYERLFGMAYYGLQNMEQLWPLVNPDLIYEIPETELTLETSHLSEYVREQNFQEIRPHVWVKPRAALSPTCTIDADIP